MSIKLLLALLLCCPAFAGYKAYYTIITDHSQAGTADSSNYPVLVSKTIGGLAQTGSGGYSTNVNGYDHVYTATLPTSSGGSFTCSSLLDWDSVIYTGTTGYVEDWVLYSTLHHSTNDIIYVCVGNSAITTFQGNAPATWVQYFQVNHLNEASAPYADSTGNGYGSTSGTYPTQITSGCAFGYCQSFLTASANYIEVLTNPYPNTTSNSVYTLWMESSSTPSATLIDSRGPSGLGTVMYTQPTTELGTAYITAQQFANTASSVADGNWHYFVVIATGGIGGGGFFYVDANLIGTVSGIAGAGHTGNFTTIGTDSNMVSPFTGKLQEVRLVNGAFVLSTSWITADYNSQVPGSTFLTVVGPTVAAASTVGYPIIF